MFYFYTIYPNEANDSFFESQKNILFSWHANDPITNDEILRTWEIASYQNNIPNPFILDDTLVQRAFFYVEQEIGDVNLDGLINVVDVVNLVNYILEITELSDSSLIQADIDNNNQINVVDVVSLINLILI